MSVMRPVLWALAVAIVAFCVVGALRAHSARADAMARADSIHGELLQAGRRADSLVLELENSAAQNEEARDSLAAVRRRADSLAAVSSQDAAENEAEAVRTGETLSETLTAARGAAGAPVQEALDTALVQLADHLSADERVAAAFREQIRQMSRSLDASEAGAMTWKREAETAFAALRARTLECETCKRENEALREAADPGFFADLLGHGKAFAAGAATTSVAILVLLVAG